MIEDARLRQAAAALPKIMRSVQSRQRTRRLAQKGKAMTLHNPPRVSMTLKIVARQRETTLQGLVSEAIDLLLVKRGYKPFWAR